MPEGSVSLVLFEPGEIGFSEVYKTLLDIGLSILWQGDKLAVWRDNGPLLFLSLARGDVLSREAAQIGQGTPYTAELSRCSAQIRIAFDDLEEVRTEVDTLVDVQAGLQDATHGFIFNTWNHKLAPPRYFV